eukprot:5108812-Amphidinium_carterae.1
MPCLASQARNCPAAEDADALEGDAKPRMEAIVAKAEDHPVACRAIHCTWPFIEPSEQIAIHGPLLMPAWFFPIVLALRQFPICHASVGSSTGKSENNEKSDGH